MYLKARSDKLRRLTDTAARILIFVMMASVSEIENAGCDSAVKKVIVAPLRNISGGVADEKYIRETISDALRSLTGIRVLGVELVDNVLDKDQKYSRNKSLSEKDLERIAAELEVDGIFFGNITSYHVPSDKERTAGSFIPLTDAVVKVETVLQYYDCDLKNITWKSSVVGYSKPMVLKIESFGISLKVAMKHYKENFIKAIKKQKPF